MVAHRLSALRERLDRLADEDGRFSVSCARTGKRPMPVTGKRFATHADAEDAASLAREYRALLRDADPDVPERRLVVAEEGNAPLQLVSTREMTGTHRKNGLPRSQRTVTLAGDRDGEWLRMKNAPLVHIAHDSEPLDDELVSRQLRANRLTS